MKLASLRLSLYSCSSSMQLRGCFLGFSYSPWTTMHVISWCPYSMMGLQSKLPFSLNSGSQGWRLVPTLWLFLLFLSSSVQSLAGLIWKATVVLLALDRVLRLQRQAPWSGQQVSCMAFNYLTVLLLAAVVSGLEWQKPWAFQSTWGTISAGA